MNTEELLALLDYSNGNDCFQYISQTETTSDLHTIQTILQESVARADFLGSVSIVGAYYIPSSPVSDQVLPRKPVVYVAKTIYEEDARTLHKYLWNTGEVPFIIVLLPNEVRVYDGFFFQREKPENAIIKSESFKPENADILREALRDFSSSSINTGQIWEKQKRDRSGYRYKVDNLLLENLRSLEKVLLKANPDITLTLIHSLIGKYIYLRYLKDRGILSDQWIKSKDIDPERIFGRYAKKKTLLQLTDILESRFNGHVFPFLPQDIDKLSDNIVSEVARAFVGDNPETKQMALFDPYNFRFIPVEMLASIYEQFIEKPRSKGAYYTPMPLADYLFWELNAVKPLEGGMRILDPACGSGTFLVLAFKRLVELTMRRQQVTALPAEQLKAILETSIYGVERELEACYVTEFSLILALLSYLDPPELEANEHFRFPSLHNTHIFECNFFSPLSSFTESHLTFDWILGNPPWVELPSNRSKVKAEDLSAYDWMESHKKNCPVASHRVADAFAWRVTDFLADNGAIGLLLPAKSLLNHKGAQFRQRFFYLNQVWRITNFANLRHVLFEKADAPAATFIYRPRIPALFDAKFDEFEDILHIGPFAANQTIVSVHERDEAWLLTINSNEIQIINGFEALKGETITWKVALWGNYRDQRMLDYYKQAFPITLNEFIKRRKDWAFSEGPQLRSKDSNEMIDPIPEIVGKPQLKADDMNASKCQYYIPATIKKTIPSELGYIRHGRNLPLSVCTGPHIIISSAWNYIVFEPDYLVIPRTWGISAPEADAELLRALSIYLSSSYVRYFLFFHSSPWGIERDTIDKTDLEKIPMPDMSPEQISAFAQFHKQLVDEEMQQMSDSNQHNFQDRIDAFIAKTLHISERLVLISHEFMQIRESLNDGRVKGTTAVAPPTELHLENYGDQLKSDLDNFVEDESIHHHVLIGIGSTVIICVVEFLENTPTQSIEVSVLNDESSAYWQEVFESIREQTGQWSYVQRKLTIYESKRVIICKSPRLIEWTRTQAMNDADSIIADIIASNEVPTSL